MTEKILAKARGLAALTREQRRDIASQGGRAAHASGNAHQYTSDEARAAAAKRQDRKRPSPGYTGTIDSSDGSAT